MKLTGPSATMYAALSRPPWARELKPLPGDEDIIAGPVAPPVGA